MKKHVLFILENNAYPYDVRVRPEVKVVKDMGFHVSVISPVNEAAKKKFESIDGVEVYRHNRLHSTNTKLGYILEYVSALVQEFLLCIKVFIKRPFHVIHAANPPDNIFLIGLFYKAVGVKFVFDHHDLSPELYLVKFNRKRDLFYRFLYLLEKLSCKTADLIISTNVSYKQIVARRHKIDPERIFIVRNDPKVNEICLHGKSVKNNDNSRIKLLFLGSINKQDGIDSLFKALHYLIYHLDEKNFICNVLGNGEYLSKAKQLTENLGISEYVHFFGAVRNRKKVLDVLLSSTICLEPAPDNVVNKHSTFIKVMEYMAAGKPIVAFDLKETRYSTNRQAILVKNNNIKAYAESIRKLMHDPELRKQLGAEGIKRIKSKLNWENASANMIRAYDSMLQLREKLGH